MSDRIDIELVNGATFYLRLDLWSTGVDQLKNVPIKSVRVVTEEWREVRTDCTVGDRRRPGQFGRRANTERRSARSDVFPVIERRAVRHILGARWGFYKRRQEDRRRAK